MHIFAAANEKRSLQHRWARCRLHIHATCSDTPWVEINVCHFYAENTHSHSALLRFSAGSCAKISKHVLNPIRSDWNLESSLCTFRPNHTVASRGGAHQKKNCLQEWTPKFSPKTVDFYDDAIRVCCEVGGGRSVENFKKRFFSCENFADLSPQTSPHTASIHYTTHMQKKTSPTKLRQQTSPASREQTAANKPRQFSTASTCLRSMLWGQLPGALRLVSADVLSMRWWLGAIRLKLHMISTHRLGIFQDTLLQTNDGTGKTCDE